MKILRYGAVSLMALVLPVTALVVFSALFINPQTGAETNYPASPYLATAPPPLELPLTLKIVTYNIADAYLFTTNRQERMRAIGELLTGLDPDIVGIQESFVAADREVLLDSLKNSRLRHHAVYPAATVGNGLLTLSAYPIIETYFHRYQANNPWYKIYQGDWWAGKGVGLARIELPSGGHIDFYNTHAQAGRGDTANQDVRFAQMGELAAFINASHSETAVVFVVGDFNTRLDRPDLSRAMSVAQLKPLLNMDTGIDLIFAKENPALHFKTLDTQRLHGTTQGSAAGTFLSRAPTPRELWRMWYGEPETTELSDHYGFMSTILVVQDGVSAAHDAAQDALEMGEGA